MGMSDYYQNLRDKIGRGLIAGRVEELKPGSGGAPGLFLRRAIDQQRAVEQVSRVVLQPQHCAAVV